MYSTIKKIAAQQKLELLRVHPLSGGDINQVFLLNCTSRDYVLKLNAVGGIQNLFETEAKGLSLLAHSKSFKTPTVINFGETDEQIYLLLEYIIPGTKPVNFWLKFSELLAKLHKNDSPRFGLDYPNFIGSLNQENNWHATASEFYICERLEPQFKMAQDKGFLFSNLDSFFKTLSEEIPNESPSLIHGDLWNGNYLVSSSGQPVLIDPAVAYAPREMDLAMMQLFGGFPSEVTSIYNEIFPITENWKERVSLWQLYYLLAHLNLFGGSYLSQVQSILKRYT